LVTLVVCFACARRTAANGVFGARELDASHDTVSPRQVDGFLTLDSRAVETPLGVRLSPHALAADAADAAAEALNLPRSTGTRFSAESLSSQPENHSTVGVRHPRPRSSKPDSSVSDDPVAADAHHVVSSRDTTEEPPSSAVFLDLKAYLGSNATPPPDADPESVAAAAEAAAAFLESEKLILQMYESAMKAFLESESALDASLEASDDAIFEIEREVSARGEYREARSAASREVAWAKRMGVYAADASRSPVDDEKKSIALSEYARAACTSTIHHKPVYVPGVFTPPKKAPSVKIPGTPPVFVPGKPAYWEPGRAPFYTPGFWTPGKPPRYVSAVRPIIVPAKKGTVIPGEFVPPSYTPGFVIPGWHETTACAVPVCVAPCQDAPVIEPEILYK
jgi:hypothetical protein